MSTYKTDIELGKRYTDPQTGISGTATSVSFYQFACERVNIETVVAGKIEDYYFDAPRLVSEETGKRAKVTKTGGPDHGVRSGVPRLKVDRR